MGMLLLHGDLVSVQNGLRGCQACGARMAKRPAGRFPEILNWMYTEKDSLEQNRYKCKEILPSGLPPQHGEEDFPVPVGGGFVVDIPVRQGVTVIGAGVVAYGALALALRIRETATIRDKVLRKLLPPPPPGRRL